MEISTSRQLLRSLGPLPETSARTPPKLREVPPGAFPGARLAGRLSYKCCMPPVLFPPRREVPENLVVSNLVLCNCMLYCAPLRSFADLRLSSFVLIKFCVFLRTTALTTTTFKNCRVSVLSGTESRIANRRPRIAGLKWPEIPQQEAKT